MNNTLLSELICTRINHDIIGNVGAVANAVELLDEGDMDFIDDINKILKTSSFVMSARLKFFRLVFGLDNAVVGSVAEISEITKNYLQTIGNANYPIGLEIKLDNIELYKPLMLLAMIGADVFIKGGLIKINQNGEELEMVCSSANSINAEKAQAIKAIVNGANDEPVAKFAPVYYLQEILTNWYYDVAIIEKESFGILIKKAG